MKNIMLLALIVLNFTACKKPHSDKGDTGDPYYYPPLSGDTWETRSAAAAGWDEAQLQSAFDYAATKNTYGLIVLQHGKIVKEQYWNNWTKDTRYYLASAGKSIVGFVAGIAQQDGIINLNDKTSTYLGAGWTSLPPAKEDLVTIKNQLTMTTGLDDNVAERW